VGGGRDPKTGPSAIEEEEKKKRRKQKKRKKKKKRRRKKKKIKWLRIGTCKGS